MRRSNSKVAGCTSAAATTANLDYIQVHQNRRRTFLFSSSPQRVVVLSNHLLLLLLLCSSEVSVLVPPMINYIVDSR